MQSIAPGSKQADTEAMVDELVNHPPFSIWVAPKLRVVVKWKPILYFGLTVSALCGVVFLCLLACGSVYVKLALLAGVTNKSFKRLDFFPTTFAFPRLRSI